MKRYILAALLAQGLAWAGDCGNPLHPLLHRRSGPCSDVPQVIRPAGIALDPIESDPLGRTAIRSAAPTPIGAIWLVETPSTPSASSILLVGTPSPSTQPVNLEQAP